MEPGASVSADCEPTPPPLQRHGSKNNFLMTSGCPPNIMSGNNNNSQQQTMCQQQQQGIINSNNTNSTINQTESPPRHPLAPRGQYRPSPTMQQRVKNLGVATPLAMQSPVRR